MAALQDPGNVVNNYAPIILTMLSMAGTVLLLLLNAKISNAVSSTRVEIQSVRADSQSSLSEVRLDVSAMRTEFAREQVSLYKEVMQGMQTANKEQAILYRELVSSMQLAYMNRSESERMHKENKERLDAIETRLEGFSRHSGRTGA